MSPLLTRIRHRWISVVVYGLVLVAGIYAVSSPPNTIRQESATALTVTWAVFVIVGGLLGLADVLDGRHLLELPGLVALQTAVVSYGVVLVKVGYDSGRGGSVTVGYLLAGLGAALLWREIEVYRLLRAVR